MRTDRIRWPGKPPLGSGCYWRCCQWCWVALPRGLPRTPAPGRGSGCHPVSVVWRYRHYNIHLQENHDVNGVTSHSPNIHSTIWSSVVSLVSQESISVTMSIQTVQRRSSPMSPPTCAGEEEAEASVDNRERLRMEARTFIKYVTSRDKIFVE